MAFSTGLLAPFWASSYVFKPHNTVPFSRHSRHGLPCVSIDHFKGQRDRTVFAAARFKRRVKRVTQRAGMRLRRGVTRISTPAAHVLQQRFR